MEKGGIGEAAFEDAGEALVFFDSDNGEGQGEKALGEWAEAGADFQDGVVGGNLGESDDTLELMSIVEEVLAEGTGQADVFGIEQGPHFSGRHVARM